MSTDEERALLAFKTKIYQAGQRNTSARTQASIASAELREYIEAGLARGISRSELSTLARISRERVNQIAKEVGHKDGG